MSVERDRRCADCESPLADDQRYCLSCGARAGARSPQLDRLLERVAAPDARGPAHAGQDAPETGARTSERAAEQTGGLRLPRARVSAVLVLAFLGFGVVLGDAASSPVNGRLTAARPPLKLVLPAPSHGATPGGAAAPPAEAESTPVESSESQPSNASAGAGASASGGEAATPSARSTGGSGASGGESEGGEGSRGEGSGGEGSGGEGSGGQGSSPSAPAKLPKVKHVFVVMLDTEPYATAFGPESPAHYLAGTLEQKGALLVRYYAVAHQQLANTIALISGQGPTPQTAQNCPTYEDIAPGTVGAEAQVAGQGCVYPSATQTLAGQLSAKHLTWRAYLQGMDEGAGSTGADGACGHPPLGAADQTAAQTPPAGQAYATFSNPFVYFQSLTGASCGRDDVGLSDLKRALSSAAKTPSFVYIAPDRCDDGDATPCAPGAPAGMGAADGFLKKVVPEIFASPAYKRNGLLVITVDQAPSSGEFADSSSCCGQPRFPNLPPSGSPLGPEGGGEVGALLLSPFIKSHAVSQESYNHFSLLRTIEDFFHLVHLGYAAGPKVSSFEASLFAPGG